MDFSNKKILAIVLSGLLCWLYFIFEIAIPYFASVNEGVDTTLLQSQALTMPFVGWLFEPTVMFVIMLVLWLVCIWLVRDKRDKKPVKQSSF